MPDQDAGLAKSRKQPLPEGGEWTGRCSGAADVAALRSPSHAPWAPTPCSLFSFPDTKPAVVSETGGDVEKELWAEPEQGAAAGGEESHGGAGAGGPVDDENQKGGGSGGGEGPQDRQQYLHRSTFIPLQLKELESVFQRSQYPDVFAR